MKKLFVTLLFAGFISFVPSSLHPSITPALSAQIPSDGLVAWYPFNGNANDESGNGNNGTVNGATLTSDRFGNVDGAFQCLNQNILAPISSNNFVGDFTLSGWVWLNGFTGVNTYPGFVVGHNSFIVLQLANTVDPPVANFYFSAGIYTGLTDGNCIGDISLGVWKHILVSVSSGMVSMFVDGVFTNSNLSPSIYQTNSIGGDYLIFGNGNQLPQEEFNGKIDDIAIYNRALSLPEIQQIYQDQTGQVQQPLTCNITTPTTTLCPGQSATLTMNTTGGAGATSQLPANLQQGLVAYYPFNGNANDESGNGENLQQNGPLLAEDFFGNGNTAMSFNGVFPNYLFSSNGYLNMVNTSLTVSAWIYPNSANAGLKSIVSKVSNTTTNIYGSYELSMEDGIVKFTLANPNGQPFWYNQCQTNGTIVFNQWHHILGVADQQTNTMQLYVDGELIATNTWQGQLHNGSNQKLIIGASYKSNFSTQYVYHFNGRIDEVALYNRALSPAEIQQLYTSQSYAWSNNATTPTITVTPTASTTYSCTVTQGNQTCTATVDITVNPDVTNAISATIIEGETYTLGTQTLTTAGTYTEVFTSAAGCDSTVTLTLSVSSACLPTYVPTNGLVGYWPFCGNANDVSGNGNNGVVNGATLTTDRFGNANSAYYFNGTNNSIVCAQPGPIGNPVISVSLWLKTTSSEHGHLVSYGNNGQTGKDFRFMINGNCPNSIAFDTYDNQKGVVANFSNSWEHYVITYDGNSGNNTTYSSIYKNGTLLTNICLSVDLGVTNISNLIPLTFGKYHGTVQNGYYLGELDDIGLYNRILTQTEIQQLYQGQLDQPLTCSITAPTTTLCEGESVTLSVNTTGGAAASSQLPANLQQGLVAYYPFNGNANDESGNGNNGTVSGATLASDRFGNLESAYSFDGVDDAIISNAEMANLGTADFSIFAWLRFESLTAVTGTVVGKRNAWGYGNFYEFGAGSNELYYEFNESSGDNHTLHILQTSNDLSWFQVGLIRQGASIRFYRNGQLLEEVDNGIIQNFSNDSPFTIGARFADLNLTEFFTGVIDDLLLYDRLLTPSEIQQLYTAQSYAWSNNATTPTITVTPTTSTSYSCTVTQGNSTCTANVDITVNPLLTWYADADADGFGNPDDVVQDCNQPQGYIADNSDCNDAAPSTYPSAEEICSDAIDNNCNGSIDENCAVFGCTIPNACNFNPQANTNDGSCILPQPETCNGLDDNCNGQVDEGFTIPSINSTSATPALYPTCTGNALKSANLLTGTDSPVIAGSGPDLWYSFTAQYNTLRVGLSAAFGDNSIGLYTNNNGCLELISEEHEVYTASTTATGNQILLTDQLTVGQTYYVAVHQITGPANASAKVCFAYLNESSCDHYYSNNTGVYTNVCNSFKAQYRANATNYLFNVLSGTQNGVNMNLTPWTYTNNNSNSVVARLGSIIPANHSGVNRVYTLSVPTVYGLTDAAGNVSNLVANATSTCTVTLNSEATITLRQADRCPTNKSLTSTIAPDRTVCGAMRYDWEFTEVLPNPGTAQVVQGGNFTTVLFLSNVPGITAGKTYSVRVRPVHSSGAFGQWGAAQCLRVGAAGMVMQSESESENVFATTDSPIHRFTDSPLSLYPNPTSTGSFVLQYNGPRRGELIFAQESMTESTFAPEAQELVMLDITGKVVFKTNVVLNGNIAEIHFGELESGLYLVDFGGERSRVQVMK